MLTRDHTVLLANHTFIRKWNEPYLPLLPSCSASQHWDRYSLSIPLRVEGWVGLSGWLQTKVVYPPAGGHPISTNRARHNATSLIRDQRTTTEPSRHVLRSVGDLPWLGSVPCILFSALTLLVWWLEGLLACQSLSWNVLFWDKSRMKMDVVTG